MRRRLVPLLAVALGLAVALVAGPRPVAAAPVDDVAATVLARMNADRADRGLVAYRAWDTLSQLAAERAQRMADTHTLSHEAAGGNVGDALDARGIDWMGYGEIIGMSGYAPGPDAADQLYTLWKDSDYHRAIMFSGSYNYVGVGVAEADDGTTWASLIMTESRDHTLPLARSRSISRSGDDVTFKWSGKDPRLQTHTAGLRSFDVQVRRDDGEWKIVRDNTTKTSIVLTNRARGHAYTFRVQASDARGNLSTWSAETRIWVP